MRVPAIIVGTILLLPLAACESALPTAAQDGGHTFGGGNKAELVAVDSDAGGGAIGSGNLQTDSGRGGHGFASGSGIGTIASGNTVPTNGGGLTFGGGNSRSVEPGSGHTFGSGNVVSSGWGYGSGGRTDEGSSDADTTTRSGVLVAAERGPGTYGSGH